MKIALCVKQVPDTTDIKWTENNTIQREGVESVINPCDVYATEFALNLKKELKYIEITAFTMGPNQASDMLRKLLALGCDDAVLISDRKFAAADTYATGLTISTAIKKVLPDFDLIICGQFASDGDTAQTGPCIAQMLNIPQVTYVQKCKNFDNKALELLREMEDGTEKVKVELPALICIVPDFFEPSRPLINGVIKAQKKEIKVLTIEDLELPPEKCGLRGSPTYVSKAFRKLTKHESQKYNLTVDESVNLIKEKINGVKK